MISSHGTEKLLSMGFEILGLAMASSKNKWKRSQGSEKYDEKKKKEKKQVIKLYWIWIQRYISGK